jgi:hypothetical protein
VLRVVVVELVQAEKVNPCESVDCEEEQRQLDIRDTVLVGGVVRRYPCIAENVPL